MHRSEIKITRVGKNLVLMDNIFCMELNNFFKINVKILMNRDLFSFFDMIILWIKLFPLNPISG